jgi:2-succinyl-5-enolpyruvyl-6-hydroxy-3-cyclohexene-1-carboxylate synthase
VLADGLSPLRNRARLVPNLVTTYDVMARSEKLTKELQPSRVLCLDEWPTSKALRQWLQAVDAKVTFFSAQAQNPDALHSRTTWLHGTVETLAGNLPRGAAPKGWLGRWLETDRKLRRRLAGALRNLDWMFEGQASALLPGFLPAPTPVFVANSMPVRDAEYFWPAGNRGHTLYFNRGANGIDGTLSTALGLAHGGAPVVLLTGDLALLHDTNGFLQARRLRGSLTIVLVNNNGGGIFEHLAVAKFDPPFEKFFATPQDADFAGLCAAYGAGHVRVKSWRHFATLLGTVPRRGVRVLELATDRKRDAAFRKELFARLAAGL